MTHAKKTITVRTEAAVPIDKAWQYWTDPNHITRWNHASDDWHCPKAENDLREGGRFSSTMAARDKSMSFDFGGVYDKVEPHRLLEFTLDDGRAVSVNFEDINGKTVITETFEMEHTNPEEMQRTGWQAIVDNFKRYAEKQ